VSHFWARIAIYNEGFSIIEMRQLIRKVRKIEQEKVSAPTSEPSHLIFMILPLDVPKLHFCPENAIASI
jgi:hypothetical protein